MKLKNLHLYYIIPQVQFSILGLALIAASGVNSLILDLTMMSKN